ncbi:MAG: HDOD domain-containing protein [Nitrospirae bacterium]|nr:HDOD domain-containing protein [Candidatus Manganitrophaceae bacterium]
MEIYLVRHPIFNRMEEVVGYEVLFRDGLDGMVGALSPDQAASKVADALYQLGIDAVSGGKKAFVPLTRNLLLQEAATVLPSSQVGVELLEEMDADPTVLTACRNLKEAGIPLVLGEYALAPQRAALLELADIVKIDGAAVSKADGDFRGRLPGATQLLASKLESRTDFESAMTAGGHLFQGSFFSKPVLMKGKEIPGFKLNYLRILEEIQRPELDFDRLEKILKVEMSLSYKLLCYINSAFFGWQVEIQSIKHALVMLGEESFRRWASFIALAGLAGDRPPELVFQATLRGRFLELLAEPCKLGHRADDLFLMGMLSLIDGLVGKPMAEILDGMPITQDIKNALLGKGGRMDDLYRLSLAYLEANWNAFDTLAQQMGIDPKAIPECYTAALAWANEHFQNIPAEGAAQKK